MFGLGALLLAQAGPWNSQEPGTMEGRAVDAKTGGPLTKVRVTLRPGTEPASSENTALPGAVTAADGTFAIRGVAPGRYYLMADRAGYVTQAYGARRPGGPAPLLTLQPGAHLKDLSVRLTRCGVVAGRVFDEDGDPVRNARIMAMRSGYVQGKRQLFPAGTTTTNDLGEYRLFDLEPGRYFFSATYRSHSESIPGVEEDYVPAYYRGGTDPDFALPVDVGAGEQVPGIDFRLTRARTVKIRGRVTNTVTPPPGATARVSLDLVPRGALAAAFSGRNNVPVSAEGEFNLSGVTPGGYLLTAAVSQSGHRYSASAALDVSSSDITGINLVVGPGLTLFGRVRALEARPVDFRRLRVLLNPGEGSTSAVRSAEIRQDGSFTLPEVSDGDYSIGVSGVVPAGFYTRSVQTGGKEVFASGIHLGGGQRPDELDIVLDATGGVIEGVALDEKQQPAAGAAVVLVPDEPARKQSYAYRTDVSDKEGHFILSAVRPGEYKLFVWPDLEEGAYFDPEFLKPYESLGERVSVRANSRENKQLRLLPSSPQQ